MQNKSAGYQKSTTALKVWKGVAAIKKLAQAAKVSDDVARNWLIRQALWEVYLPAPQHIPRPKFDVPTSSPGSSRFSRWQQLERRPWHNSGSRDQNLQRGWRSIQNGGYGEKSEKIWVRDMAEVKINKMAEKGDVQFKFCM